MYKSSQCRTNKYDARKIFFFPENYIIFNCFSQCRRELQEFSYNFSKRRNTNFINNYSDLTSYNIITSTLGYARDNNCAKSHLRIPTHSSTAK